MYIGPHGRPFDSSASYLYAQPAMRTHSIVYLKPAMCCLQIFGR